ncbi:MAG: carbohydrate-binding domain-containing protein [Chloroflexi bacterium]|nr:carbohydrate-binding domain-containing protein [Chloroflexota bacterium]
MKKLTILFLLVLLILSLNACASSEADAASVTDVGQAAVVSGDTAVSTPQTATVTAVPTPVEFAADDLDTTSTPTTTITLSGEAIAVAGEGAVVNGGSVTITAAGTYSLSGVLNDGQIVVDTMDGETVALILNGVDVTYTSGAPVYVSNAAKVVITLAEGTENVITDGPSYAFADAATDEPNAALFSHDDLTINGRGSLTVNANYNNGIVSKDDLKITGGTITVNAVNDGLKGRDSIALKDANITIIAGGDGIQANNDEDAEMGYVAIESGAITITAGLDGIQAETSLLVSGGDITITTGGSSGNSSTTGGGLWGGPGMEGNPNKPEESAKGLKAGADVAILAGTIAINSADDAIHSNGSLTINDGAILAASGDDGLHADATLVINGGALDITQAYEGIESAMITINGGAIHLVASDDGINVAGGSDGSAVNGRPGQNELAASGSYHLTINGGYLYVDAGGDGLDSNGAFDMTGGFVIVNGPTNNGNGPLDYVGSFNISGGFLVAVGSSGMAQAPSETSSQYALIHNFDALQAAGTLVHIESADGESILTFMPAKDYQSVLISAAALQNGETYVVYTGGSASGTAVDGLYADGTASPGTQAASYTVSGMVAGNTAAMGGGPGGVPGGGGIRPARP